MTIQDSAHEERIDYNALDNTFAGQCIQAGFIAAFAALPAARVPVVLANVVTIAAFNAFDEDKANDLTAVVDEEQGEEDSVGLSWGVLAGLAAGAAGACWAAAKAVDAVAAGMGKRGVDKPEALLGVGLGAAYLAAERFRK